MENKYFIVRADNERREANSGCCKNCNSHDEKQIEEMAKVIANIPPITFPVGSRLQGKHIYTLMKFAEHLYNAGYCKQSEGEWKKTDRRGISINGFMVCSACDVMIPTCDDKTRYCLSRLHYCPKCGAKMKGGE